MSKKFSLKQRGLVAFSKQLGEGGTYTTDEVAQLLAMTKIEVLERTGTEFLSVKLQGDASYPCWQFDGNCVVNNFSEVMALLNTNSSVGIVQFFLTKDEDLSKSPIEALKDRDPKELATIKIFAKQFYQQVAR